MFKILIILMIFITSNGQNVSGPETIKFKRGHLGSEWYALNDNVMGGVSSGYIQMTKQSTAIWKGRISLENNGGFSSIRSPRGSYDLSGIKSIVLNVKGDGRTYGFTLRPTTQWYRAYYKAEFETEKDRWMTIKLELEDFKKYRIGRVVDSSPELKWDAVKEMGLILFDKNEGNFRFEIEKIEFNS